MKRRVSVRLRTRTVFLDLPVPRLECPVCNNLDRIQNVERDKKTLIRRGGDKGSCGHCDTQFEAETFTGNKERPIKFRYNVVKLAPIVKEQLANYWTQSHKGPLPKILQLEVPK